MAKRTRNWIRRILPDKWNPPAPAKYWKKNFLNKFNGLIYHRPAIHKHLMKFSFRRKITSYSKVRILISALIRGSTLFMKKRNIAENVLLNVGCGPNIFPYFINLDFDWTKKIDIVWDIRKKPYPLKDDSLEGIFTEHCLEHISFADCEKNLREFHRMLKPGGNLRIVVPD